MKEKNSDRSRKYSLSIVTQTLAFEGTNRRIKNLCTGSQYNTKMAGNTSLAIKDLA